MEFQEMKINFAAIILNLKKMGSPITSIQNAILGGIAKHFYP